MEGAVPELDESTNQGWSLTSVKASDPAPVLVMLTLAGVRLDAPTCPEKLRLAGLTVSAGSGFTIEDVTGDLHRIVPAAGGGFAGLAPGASVRIPYLTDLLLNASFLPRGPYIVFDAAKDVGVPLSDFVAVPFERPRVASPENQFTLDSVIRDIPASELPPVFPTAVAVTKGTGELRLLGIFHPAGSSGTSRYFPGGKPGITNDVRCTELKVPQKNSARSYGWVPGASSSHWLRRWAWPPAILSLFACTAFAIP